MGKGPDGGTGGSDEMPHSWGFETLGHFDFGADGVAALQDSETLWKVRQLNEDDMTMALKRVFERYNVWERGTSRSRMDKMRFSKALRDSQFITGHFSADVGDGIFSDVRPASVHQINFIQFIEALRHVAVRSRLSLNEVIGRVVAVGGPIE
eukprot:evm.model.scf_2945.2 EVM.evm.TU.scf_2945.2   scf_2945:16328-17103(+)